MPYSPALSLPLFLSLSFTTISSCWLPFFLLPHVSVCLSTHMSIYSRALSLYPTLSLPHPHIRARTFIIHRHTNKNIVFYGPTRSKDTKIVDGARSRRILSCPITSYHQMPSSQLRTLKAVHIVKQV